MKINIAEQLLPEVYNRRGKDCYLDPIRQKLIYITPEETVRQRMISYLVNELKVPKEAILVEEHLSHYNVPSKKRADIVVHGKKDETQYPVLIVECKGPDALQLSFDDNIQVIDDKVTIYHSGRIAIGNKGSGKIDELRQFVAERYPKIIDGKRFNLGSLKNDYQWNIDQSDVTEVIVNLISYALIRDEYRDYIKQQ